jgi:putative intracellular protease/amidase
MQIVIALFDRFTALDAVGPHQVLHHLPGAEVIFAAERAGGVTDETGTLTLQAPAVYADVPSPDILVVPGGPGQAAQMTPGPLRAPTRERYVFDGKYVTGAGVSAGLDRALALAGRVAGDDAAQRIQLAIEYDPHPPYQSGSPATARPEIVDPLAAGSRFASLT